MSEKRKRSVEAASDDRKKRKVNHGFRVGPDNLPDGPYKRKVQKRKAQLIEKAQIKKQYSKVKQDREEAGKAERPPAIIHDANDAHEPNTAPHPDRQTLIDEPSAFPDSPPNAIPQRSHTRKPKAAPFKREYQEAQQRRVYAEEERKRREAAVQQRQQKRDERERFQKAIAKARRGGKNGQRKLGRESHGLLERVKRMVGDSG